MQQLFPTQRFSEIDKRPADFKLLERIPLTKEGVSWPVQLSESVGDESTMILLDTETTGLSTKEDSIIELGMVKVSYSPAAKRLVSIDDVVSLYDDPGKPIPEFITKLTGISDHMVAGQKISDSLVNSWMEADPLVVAHNASFDRRFFETRFKGLDNLAWACSVKGIDWQMIGFESRKLEYILLRLGWFYEGHRAAIDCLAMAWLFYQLPVALASLLSVAKTRTVMVRAWEAPFHVQDSLKKRGYRWHAEDAIFAKHWYCEIKEKDLAEERDCLQKLFYKGEEKAGYEYLDARSRFKVG